MAERTHDRSPVEFVLPAARIVLFGSVRQICLAGKSAKSSPVDVSKGRCDQVHAKVGLNQKLNGKVGRWTVAAQGVKNCGAQSDGAQATRDGDQKRFRGELAQNAHPAGTDRKPDSEFPAAVKRAAAEEHAEIRAGGKPAQAAP